MTLLLRLLRLLVAVAVSETCLVRVTRQVEGSPGRCCIEGITRFSRHDCWFSQERGLVSRMLRTLLAPWAVHKLPPEMPSDLLRGAARPSASPCLLRGLACSLVALHFGFLASNEN